VSEANILALPKAEVHVHLEGCFEPADVERLARESGETLPRPVEQLFDVTGVDLSAFLEVLDWSCGLVRTPDQLARAAYSVAEREAKAGAGYADVIVNPTHWSAWRERLEAFVDALDAGFVQAETDGLPRIGLCVSLLRQQTASEALELVEWLVRRRHPRVVALSIDGNEAASGRTGPRFAEAFSRAAKAGLHRTVHAGESSGPEGVRDALDFLGAERIDHGIRAVEDPDLVAELADRRIPLNVCPGSNVLLGTYPDRSSHPLDALRRAGVLVTINTDDPALMRLSLVSEYAASAQAYGWDTAVLRQLARTSIEASFCDDDLRRRLLGALEQWESPPPLGVDKTARSAGEGGVRAEAAAAQEDPSPSPSPRGRGSSLFGARVRRTEDPRLLTGHGAYIDDLQLPGQLHMVVWRSPLAHAIVRRVSLDRVRALAGVVDAFDARAFGPSPPAFPVLLSDACLKACPQYPLAGDRVRYRGEGVAVVIAEQRAIAEDALELVDVELEPLEPVPSTEAALLSGAPQLHADVPANRCAEWTLRTGDVDAAFLQAEVVVRERLCMQRYTGVPIETRGVIAQQDPITGELVIWVSGQWPHTTRTLAAGMLGLAEDRIRVVVPDVGGGFGVKEEFYPEDLLVPFTARRLGRPVKWIEERREHFLSVVHAREQVHELELALLGDGTLLGLRDRIVTDMGAYVRALGFVNPSLAAASVPGPYRIANVQIDSVAVVTNKSPTSPYRGAGQPEATFARERALDIAAARLGIDPAEIRRRNLIPAEMLPFDTGLRSVDGPVRFDSGDFPRALETALQVLDYAHLREAQAKLRREGRLPGIGLAVYAQITGTGPFEGADVRVGTDGRVTVSTGAVAIGQGLATALAQIVSHELGVPINRVQVMSGDTARIAHGLGTFASRAAVMAGNAAAIAAGRVRAKALELAAHMREVSPDDVEWLDGAARVRGVADSSLSLAQLAQACLPGKESRPSEMEPGLEARHYYENHSPAFAYGVHGVEVDVDRETGAVRIARYVVVSDSGRLVNPTIAEGQIVGGIAQGLGGALMEHLIYDDQGQLVTASLLDYAMPTATDVPMVEMVHLEIPSPLNPLGIKGLGEGGAVGAHAAVANAVADALIPLGVKVQATPLSPGAISALLRDRR
jgi:aerobic carbon-monoxide dehydrogenase large subunit